MKNIYKQPELTLYLKERTEGFTHNIGNKAKIPVLITLTQTVLEN